MTDKNLTEIAVVLDRSGSMASIRADMEGGFKRFIEEQRAVPGRCLVSLYQFDTVYDVVFEERDAREVHGMTLDPRGGTALLDAVGRSVTNIGQRLARKAESQRPGAVIVMIITDGQENASTEWKKERVREIVERQQRDYNWKFLFLGADLNAFADAQSLGVNIWAQYTPNAMGTAKLYEHTSRSIGEYRNQVSAGVVGASLNLNPDLTTGEK